MLTQMIQNINITEIIAYLFIFSSFILMVLSFREKKQNKLEIQSSVETTIGIGIDETIKITKFFDDFLLIKFQYYLNSFILAYFISDKDIDKKDIKKLKEDFYTDVTKTLNAHQQQQLLKVFTSQGVILYIHQSFLRLLNDANIKFKNSSTGMDAVNQNTLRAIYK